MHRKGMIAMNKQEVYDYLTEHGVSYEVTEHKAVFNMEELVRLIKEHGNEVNIAEI